MDESKSLSLDHLLVYQPVHKKTRLGKLHDGGYVICELDGDYDVFLSGGLGDDISFERQMLDKYPDLMCNAFDGTIDTLPNYAPLVEGEDQWIPVSDEKDEWIYIGEKTYTSGVSHTKSFGKASWSNTKKFPEQRKYVGIYEDGFKLVENPDILTWDEAEKLYDFPKLGTVSKKRLAKTRDVMDEIFKKRKPLSPNITFFRKNLGKRDRDTTSNLREYFDKFSNIFMKIDIEGAEYEFFESLSDKDLLKIKQLVIEFHGGNRGEELQKRLAKTHWLVHFHPNNHDGDSGVTMVDEVKLPNVKLPNIYECTYIRKNAGERLQLNSNPVPDPAIDMPNIPNLKDILLSGYPYIAPPIEIAQC